MNDEDHGRGYELPPIEYSTVEDEYNSVPTKYMDAPQKSGRSVFVPLCVIVALVALVCLFISVFLGDQSNDANPPKASAPSSESAFGPASTTDCNVLKFDENRDFNVVTNVADNGYAVNNRQEDLAAVKRDPKNLAVRAWQIGEWSDPTNWVQLANDDHTCLSAKGVEIYNTIYTKFTESSTVVDEDAKAPSDYYNSGMNSEGPVINATAGISGDLSAIKYTLADHQEVYVLKRCGNPVFRYSPPQYFSPVVIPQPYYGYPPQGGYGGGGGGYIQPPYIPPPVCTSCECLGNCPPPPPPPPVCTTCECLGNCPPPPPPPKIPALDPFPQGNAPQGGGPNLDLGPGLYIPPVQMERPPATPRVNPPPPPPVQSSGGSGMPTPTQAPPPPPVETGAGSGSAGSPSAGNGANGDNDGDPGGF